MFPHLVWRIAGATGTGFAFGGNKGAKIGLAASTFFSLATPEMISTVMWRSAQSLRFGVPLAAGGRSLLSFSPRLAATGAAETVGGVGAGALVAGYTLGALVGTGAVSVAESQGWVEEGTTADLGDLYLSVVGLGDRSPTGALKDWGSAIVSIPFSLNAQGLANSAVAGNAAGYNEGTVIDPTTGRPRAESGHVSRYREAYESGQYRR